MNDAIHWTEGMLIRFEGKWEGYLFLREGMHVEWTTQVIERYFEEWNVHWIFGASVFEALIEPYANEELVEEVMQGLVASRASIKEISGDPLKP